jgi:hypothetical protein
MLANGCDLIGLQIMAMRPSNVIAAFEEIRNILALHAQIFGNLVYAQHESETLYCGE